ARFLHKRRAARLHRFGDPESAVRITRTGAAIALGLVHTGVPVGCRRDRELASRGAAAARLTRVDVDPTHATVGGTPDAHVVGGSVDHACVRRIYRESCRAAGRPEGRFESLPGLRAQDNGTVLE